MKCYQKAVWIISFFIMIFFTGTTIIYGAVDIITKNNDELNLYCNANIAMDAETGNILYGKNATKKVYPASTTKILTAILAIENLDLDEKITASRYAVYSTPIGSSLMYIKEGEILTVKELLYGLMLPSGNDAGNVIAEAVSGNVAEFIDLMNQKLKEIGCVNSHFTNAHGFHDNNHYTTAYDMALLLKYAMQYDVFREIIETKYIELPATNKSDVRKLENTNKMFDKSYTRMYYPYILGGKTGYTVEARGTFIGYGMKDDKLVIVGAFDGSQNIDNGQQGRFLDSITLFNYCFEHYDKKTILEQNKTFEIKDKNSQKIYTVGLAKDINMLVKNEPTIINYTTTIDFENLQDVTIQKDTTVGHLLVQLKGENFDIQNDYPLVYISAKDDTRATPFSYYLPIIIAIILFILLILLLMNHHKNKKKKLKKFNHQRNSRTRSSRKDQTFQL